MAAKGSRQPTTVANPHVGRLAQQTAFSFLKKSVGFEKGIAPI
jgi:hypothetical protein